MKFRIIVKMAEMLLGQALSDDRPRADMYLPIKILALGIVLIIAGVFVGAYALMNFSAGAAVLAAGGLGLGVPAVLCWRNQTITMISEETFVYTNMWGKTTEYRFDRIERLVPGRDSMTLLVDGGKVHIESCAVLSPQLVERINRQL